MTYSVLTREPVLDMVAISGPWGMTGQIELQPAGPATLEAATRTLYYPMNIPVTCTLRRFFWVNGAAVAGTITMAMYDNSDFKPKNRLVTASATQTTTDVVQFATPAAAKVLTPNIYWLAIAGSSATAQFRIGAYSNGFRHAAKWQEAAVTCPATAGTMAVAGSANFYMIGFSTQTSP